MVKILVSACQLGCKVRYNGTDLPVEDALLRQVLSDNETVSFCPEVSGGLPTPRPPAEIQNGNGDNVLDGQSRILSVKGEDVTDAFIHGAELALEECQKQNIQFAVLTESSPSCGSSRIHNGNFAGVKKAGMGVTAALLKRHGVQVFSQFEAEALAAAIKHTLSKD